MTATADQEGSSGRLVHAAQRRQIKTRDRVRDLAEVYTHEREVHAMLDLISDMFPSVDEPGKHDRTFLEPACGSGNFLEEILRRKLTTVTVARYGRNERYEHRILRCLASVYGIDIDIDNVIESRDRLRAVIQSHLDNDLNTQACTGGLATAVEVILATNIIRADTLVDAPKIELVQYHPGRAGTFTREWSFLDESGLQLDLFSQMLTERRKDAVAIHYSTLKDYPQPTVGKTPGRRRCK